MTDWPLGELVLVSYLGDALAARVLTETPDDLAEQVPLVRVHQVPGGGDDRVTDSQLMDVECFGADRIQAWQLTTQMRRAMNQLGGQYVPGAQAVVDTAETVTGPGEIPYRNKAVRRTVATYRLTCRAQ